MRRVEISKCIGFTLEGVSFNNVVVREITPVDEFYFERSMSSDDGRQCISYTDPIRMLFNQQRLNKIGSTAIQAWLDSLNTFKKDAFSDIRSKCSDDELISMIKSRHIQQPSELMSYLQECENNVNLFNLELKRVQNEYKNQKLKQQKIDEVRNQMSSQQDVNISSSTSNSE